jgi:hypothetical protein
MGEYPVSEREVDRMMSDLNEWAKSIGRHASQHCSQTPPYEGSILDIPVTLESEERIRKLDALLAELEQKEYESAKPDIIVTKNPEEPLSEE